MTLIKENKSYYGEMIHEWNLSHKGKYVITGAQQGESSINKMIGKVVQIRLEAGMFGSDIVLLRNCEGELAQHHNQSFWVIPDEFKDYLDGCFDGVYEDDSDKFEYTLDGGKHPHTGFIIESKVKDGDTTPMREIKNRIFGMI